MRITRISPLLLLGAAVSAAAQPAPRDLDITAPDGGKLRATYYAAAAPGPGVVLLHMCNTTRVSWAPVAQQLSAAGINALTVDNRGFGESAEAAEKSPPEAQTAVRQKWPADFDAVFAYLVTQPGLDKTRVGVGGGSCGVNNAVRLASRHPEVRSLVLLAGPTDGVGVNYLLKNPWIPIFTAAAADDQFSSAAPQEMQWLADIGGNPRNQFMGFRDGKHGTEIFGPHPELPKAITAFFIDTLVKSPADAKEKIAVKSTPARQFWTALAEPGGAAKAAQMYRDARRRDPNAYLFPETALNLAGYDRLQQNRNQEAVELFKLNTEAYPASANTYDSLSDGYIALGLGAEALAAEQKCLELLSADSGTDEFKRQLRQTAEEKLAKLKEQSSRP